MRIFAQRQKAAVEAAKNAQIDLILPPAAAQDNGVPERSDFVWRFKVGDDVVSCPETELKVRGNQGEVFRGKVAEIDDSTHLVTIRSWLSGRCHPAIHESRVRVAPKSANMYDYPDTRASAEDVNVGLQSQYEKEVRKNLKQEIKIAEYTARLNKLEEQKPVLKELRKEMGVLAGEIQQLKTANAILRGVIRDSAQTTSAHQIFSRSGLSADATPVYKAIRATYLEKLFEGEERDEAAQQNIAELNARIVELTMELKADVKEEVELKREIKRLNGEIKRQAKELEEHEVAAELDQLKNDFEDSLKRRLQYVSRCSAYTTYALMYEKFSRSFINKERRQLGIEQGIINACKLAKAKYYRQFFNDSSDKKGANIMCTSILVEYASTKVDGVDVRGETELLILSAADLPRDKTALGNFNSVQLVLEYLKEKLTMFTQHCKVQGDDVSKFPDPDGISLIKMADGSVNTSDHCVVALSLKSKIDADVKSLVEAEYTQEYLDALTPAARKALCLILDMGCLPHLRSLLGEAQIKAEAAFIKANFPPHPQHMRMEPDLDALMLSILKYVGEGGMLAGKRNDFIQYCNLHQQDAPYQYLGRPGNGNRMDVGFETASKIALIKDALVAFSTYHDRQASTIISKSVNVRIASTIFDIALCHRHLWWIKFYRLLRKLWNSNDNPEMAAAGHCTVLSYVVMDQIEEKLQLLRGNPALLRDPNWHFFSPERNPCLAPFMREIQQWDVKTFTDDVKVNLAVHEARVAYQPLNADQERMMNELTVMFCDAALNKLYSLAPHLLTSQDGYMSEGKISVEDQAKLAHVYGNNITACEAVFAQICAQLLLSRNFSLSTAEAIALARLNGLYNRVVNIGWHELHIKRCMEFSHSNLDYFLEQDAKKLRLQEMATQERLVANALAAMISSVAAYRKTVAYFSLSYTLTYITTVDELLAVLAQADMQTVKAQSELCKLFILLEHFGNGDKDVKKEMSSSTEQAVGTLPNLKDRCMAILGKPGRVARAGPVAPLPPAIVVAPHLPTQQYRDIVVEQSSQLLVLQERILRTFVDHCTTLRWAYSDVQLIEFETEPLTTVQEEFKVGRVFTLDGEVFVVNGLSRDQKQNDYCVWYHAQDLIPPPTHMADERVKHSNFKSYDVRRGKTITAIKGIDDLTIVWL